jgi:hypothetical protein
VDHIVRGLEPEQSNGAPRQLRFFATRCPTCAVRHLCGEQDSASACGDPAEYRSGALHPDRVALHPEHERHYRFPDYRTGWASDPQLPSILPVAPSVPTDLSNTVAIDAKGALALVAPGPATIACLPTDDWILERLWRQRSQLGRVLKQAGIQLVIAAPFSGWWDDPPLEGLHAMARTARLATLIGSELPTVPAIVWRTNFDLARWADWFAQSRPSAVAVDLSTLKRPNTWTWAMHGLATFATQLNNRDLRPRLVVVGPFALPRIQEVRSVWPQGVAVASRGVWQASRARVLLSSDGRRSRVEEITLADLLARNVATMEAVTDSARLTA